MLKSSQTRINIGLEEIWRNFSNNLYHFPHPTAIKIFQSNQKMSNNQSTQNRIRKEFNVFQPINIRHYIPFEMFFEKYCLKYSPYMASILFILFTMVNSQIKKMRKNTNILRTNLSRTIPNLLGINHPIVFINILAHSVSPSCNMNIH